MKLRQFLPIFSYIFHPIFISLYGTLFYFLLVPHYITLNGQYITLIQVTILTLLLPLVSYFLLLSLGKVNSFTEATINERKIPISIQIVLFFILLHTKDYDGMADLYLFYLGGLISAVLALFFVFLKTKVSLHMIGITSLVYFIYMLMQHYMLPYIYTFAFCIVCIGLVASSRLYMKSHTANELILGSLIGFASQYICWSFYNI